MPSISTFEILPNEILMIIVNYSGDVYSVYRSFFGLNQRLNNILTDKYLHLFNDLIIDQSDIYSNRIDVQRRLLPLEETTENAKPFYQFLRSRISFLIREKYEALAYEFQSNLRQFQSLRTNLIDNEASNLDDELRRLFESYPNNLPPFCEQKSRKFFSESIQTMKQIESLILNQGASLNYDQNQFHFAKIINEWLISKVNLTQCDDQRFLNSLINMSKLILISNSSLIQVKHYTNTYAKMTSPHYFLIDSIYQLRYFPDARYEPVHSMKIHWYKSQVHLFLFLIHYLNHFFDRELWLEDCLFDVLDKIKFIAPLGSDDLFIQTSQLEILTILLEKYEEIDSTLCDGENRFPEILQNLFQMNHIVVIQLIYKGSRNMQYLFEKFENYEQVVDIMTGNQKKKRLFEIVLNDEQLRTWFINKNVLFILLKKKQVQLSKHLLKLSPALIHRLDQEGNDPLLYICLKVRGCRHRLIEFFIKMGSDLSRTNWNNINFFNALQMTKNKHLLDKLIEHEIIQNDYISNEVKQDSHDVNDNSY